MMLPKGQRNLVRRDCYGDAVGFATLRKAAMRQLVGIDFTTGPWPDSGAVGSSSLGLFLSVGAGDKRGGLQHVRLQLAQRKVTSC